MPRLTRLQGRTFQKCTVRAIVTNQPHSYNIQHQKKIQNPVDFHSLLKGQETERSRLAKELHDGLGSLLSSVKYSLQRLGNDMDCFEKDRLAVQRTACLVDSSISELRRITHNLMPPVLETFGLDAALRDYCHEINMWNRVRLTYQSFNMDIRLEKCMEINIYRIIQELLHNILKHAEASEAMLQLVLTGNELNITIEDNGKGFEYCKLYANKGAGLVNICNRVDYLKGKINFQSEPRKGTSVFIELNISDL